MTKHKSISVPTRKDGIANRESILVAAMTEFAAKGYQAATVREICKTAGVNIGAVTRHFGGKEQLYREVLVRAGQTLLAREPVPKLEDYKNARQALRAWMRFDLRVLLLHRPSDPVAGRLLMREMKNPSKALEPFGKLVLAPMRMELSKIVKALLGKHATPERILTGTNFVHSNCAFQAIGSRMLEKTGQPTPQDEEGVDHRVATLFPMVLAGVLATKGV